MFSNFTNIGNLTKWKCVVWEKSDFLKRNSIFLRWNKSHFLWFFQGFQLPEIVSDQRLALLTILAIKGRYLCNFTKNFKGRHSCDIVERVWRFQLLLNSKSLKLSLHILLKNMSKILILDLKERGYFFEFCFMFKVSQGLTS